MGDITFIRDVRRHLVFFNHALPGIEMGLYKTDYT